MEYVFITNNPSGNKYGWMSESELYRVRYGENYLWLRDNVHPFRAIPVRSMSSRVVAHNERPHIAFRGGRAWLKFHGFFYPSALLFPLLNDRFSGSGEVCLILNREIKVALGIRCDEISVLITGEKIANFDVSPGCSSILDKTFAVVPAKMKSLSFSGDDLLGGLNKS